ncbi:AEC family transporter [Rhizobium sp. 16-544-2B]
MALRGWLSSMQQCSRTLAMADGSSSAKSSRYPITQRSSHSPTPVLVLTTLLIVMPIFAVILVGWLAATFNILGPQAGAEINRLVVWLAMPALLFTLSRKQNGAHYGSPD